MKKKNFTASFVTGAIALAFLIIGYQTALLVHKAATLRIAAIRDHPDTVYILPGEPLPEGLPEQPPLPEDRPAGRTPAYRKEAPHSAAVQQARAAGRPPRKVENFLFDPNTVSVPDLERLGFSRRQAESIDKYRRAGGRFRRKSDFAKSYVVDDSVFERLAPYIQIPRIDLNRADSALFETLPGIGKYFAAKMVSYRERLGGYSYPEQLMDIRHFEREKYDALKDLITVREATCSPFPLWTASEEVLARHPYIGRYGAHGIVLYRENTPRDSLSVAGIRRAGILPPEDAARLERCRIAVP